MAKNLRVWRLETSVAFHFIQNENNLNRLLDGCTEYMGARAQDRMGKIVNEAKNGSFAVDNFQNK